MSDSKENNDQQHRVQVHLNDRVEVEYLYSLFPRLSREQVNAAIEKAGPFRDDIMQELKRIWN